MLLYENGGRPPNYVGGNTVYSLYIYIYIYMQIVGFLITKKHIILHWINNIKIVLIFSWSSTSAQAIPDKLQQLQLFVSNKHIVKFRSAMFCILYIILLLFVKSKRGEKG